MNRVPEHYESSGNVFADLGLANAPELQVKADLAWEITRTIEERDLTQAQAAALLGVDQPKISALVRGRLAGFSLERLYRFLNALGKEVEIVVRTPSTRKADPSVRVVMADRKGSRRPTAAKQRAKKRGLATG
jgi:predicted XRE-type DNA-binding protein